MTKIYKTALFCFLIAASFTACKKNDKNSDSKGNASAILSFDDNGSKVTLNNCVALDISTGDLKQISITSNENNGNRNFSISLIQDITLLKAGDKFTVYNDVFNLPVGSMTMFYSTSATGLFTTQAGNPVGSVTITAVSSTEIKGNFSGNLYDTDDSEGLTLKHKITDGTFTASRSISL